MEIFVFARFHAQAGQENAVAELLQQVITPTNEEEGCLFIHAFRSVQDPCLFFIHSRWQDMAALDTHVNLPHTVRFVEAVQPLLDQPLDVSRTERIG